MRTKKYRSGRRAAAGVLAAVLAAASLVGCAKGSADQTESSGSGESQSVTLGNPNGSGNDPQPTIAPVEHVNMFDIAFGDYVDVSKWKDVKVTKEETTPSDYQLQYALCYRLQSVYNVETAEVKDRSVQAGDTVTIDFTGYVDGEELENGSGTNQTLTIGSERFIDGFEEGLVGAKTGDKLTLELHFPDPYPNNTELNGKPVTFEVTVKGITGYETITDDMIKEATDGEFETYDAFLADFREKLTKELREMIVWQKVMESIESKEVCQELVDDYIDTYMYTISVMASNYGIDAGTFVYYSYGCSLDEFKKMLEPSGEDYAKQSCAVLAIADQEKITVEDSEIEERRQELLKDYESEEELEESGNTRDSIKFDLLLDKVEALIYDTIQIQES